MMKMRMIYFGLLLNCLIYYTHAQICNSIDGYDTKTIASADQWQVTTDEQCLSNPAANCTYYITFCAFAPMCPGYSACQNASGSSKLTFIGEYTPHLFYANDSKLNGFYAHFPATPMQNISNTTVCTPSLRINFHCNLDAKWTVPLSNMTGYAPQPTNTDVDPNDPCFTILDFDYAGACLHGKGPDDNNRIGPGSIFLIILFSSALIYFIGGALFNKLVKHQSGINLIPQAQFWIGLPLHAIEGCRSTLSCCSSTPKPSEATYQSV